MNCGRLIICVIIISLNQTVSCPCFSGTVQSLGLKPLGEETGTAEILSRVIIERMI